MVHAAQRQQDPCTGKHLLARARMAARRLIIGPPCATPPSSSTPTARRWHRKRLVHRVDARLCTKTGIIVDISYGGAQLQLRNPVRELPLPNDPIVFAPDLRLGARRVWSRAAGADGPWWYGLELDA